MRRDRLYEHYCCHYLINNENCQKAWTWQNIPENILLEANLINEPEQLRLERKYLKNNNLKTDLNAVQRFLKGSTDTPNPLQDFGIDLLAQKENGEYIVGQSKCYSDGNNVRRNELTGVFEYRTMPDLIQHQFVVFYTTELCRRLTENIMYRRYPENLKFSRLLMPDDWTIPESITPPMMASGPVIDDRITLRDYQLEAIEKLKTYFLTDETVNDNEILDSEDELDDDEIIDDSEIDDDEIIDDLSLIHI